MTKDQVRVAPPNLMSKESPMKQFGRGMAMPGSEGRFTPSTAAILRPLQFRIQSAECKMRGRLSKIVYRASEGEPRPTRTPELKAVLQSLAEGFAEALPGSGQNSESEILEVTC